MTGIAFGLAALVVLCTAVALVIGSPIPDRHGDRAQLRRDDEEQT